MSQIPGSREDQSRFKGVKNKIIAGIFIIIPIGVSLWFGIIVFRMFTEWAKALLFMFPVPDAYKDSAAFIFLIRFFSLFVLLGFLFTIGHLAKYALSRKLLSYTDKLMLRVPMLKTVYSAISQIMDTIKSSKSASFSKAVMFEHPRKGIYSIGFVSSMEVSDKISTRTGTDQELVSVFLATTPNPTSGFFLMIPKKDCIFIDIGVDDAMKMIISGGALQPKHFATAQKKPANQAGETNGADKIPSET